MTAALTPEARDQIRQAAKDRVRDWPPLTTSQLAALAGPMDVGMPGTRPDDQPGTAA